MGSEFKVAKQLLEKHRLTVGGEYRDNFRQDQRNYDVNPFFSYLHDKRSSQVWAFYFQDEVSLLDNLILNVGLRYDHYSSFGSRSILDLH